MSNLNQMAENVEYIIDNSDKETSTVGFAKRMPDGKISRTKQILSKADAAQLAVFVEKLKKQKEEFDKKNGVIHAPDEGSGADRRQREIFRSVREKQISERQRR